jgi:hypothetical protein
MKTMNEIKQNATQLARDQSYNGGLVVEISKVTSIQSVDQQSMSETSSLGGLFKVSTSCQLSSGRCNGTSLGHVETKGRCPLRGIPPASGQKRESEGKLRRRNIPEI